MPFCLALERQLGKVTSFAGSLLAHNLAEIEELWPRAFAEVFVDKPVLLLAKAVQLRQVYASLLVGLTLLELLKTSLDLPDLLALVAQNPVHSSDLFRSPEFCHFN